MIGIIFSIKMKIYIAVFFLLFVNACASIDTNRIAPGYADAFTSIKQLLLGVENNIEPEVIKNIPYASILVRIGNGPTALMILENITEEGYSWVSADGVYLIIKNGKIIKTHGLPNNLKEKLTPLEVWDQDLFINLEFISYYSYSEPLLNNLKVISSYSVNEEENVELFFDTKKLSLIEEKIIASQVNWSKTNKYWIDDDNFVWKSVQHISPRLPEFYIEVTKKPR